MSQGKNVPQSLYQPPVGTSKVLSRLDGVSIGTVSNYVLYTAPARTRVTVRWFSLGNRGSGGSGRLVSIFVTDSAGVSPRIYHETINENATAAIVSPGAQFVINPGDKIEALADTNAVTADVYISGEVERVPS